VTGEADGAELGELVVGLVDGDTVGLIIGAVVGTPTNAFLKPFTTAKFRYLSMSDSLFSSWFALTTAKIVQQRLKKNNPNRILVTIALLR
jgi:hypothetical protein